MTKQTRWLTGLVISASIGCGGGKAVQAGGAPAQPPGIALRVASSPPPPESFPPPEAKSLRAIAEADTKPSETPLAPTPMPQRLTDEQIVGVVGAVHFAEVGHAKLARARSKNAAVRRLAAMTIDDDGTAQRKRDITARKQDITATKMTTSRTAAKSAMSEALRDDATKMLAHLEEAKDAEFDVSYLLAQIDIDVRALALIEDELLPRVADADIRTVIRDLRSDLSRHLQQAGDLQEALWARAARGLGHPPAVSESVRGGLNPPGG